MTFLATDRASGATITNENIGIQQNIADILTTPLGSRIMRRDYGSDLPDFTDEPLTPFDLMAVRARIASAIKKFEPRVKLTRIITALIDAAGSYSFELQYYRIDIPDNSQQTYTQILGA